MDDERPPRGTGDPSGHVRIEIKYFSWSWDELPDEAGAAFAEQWSYGADGALLERKRVPLEKRGRTISTDPRAAAIMREEAAETQADRPMGGPHW